MVDGGGQLCCGSSPLVTFSVSSLPKCVIYWLGSASRGADGSLGVAKSRSGYAHKSLGDEGSLLGPHKIPGEEHGPCTYLIDE